MRLPALKYVYEQQWLVDHCVGKDVLHLGCAGDMTLCGGERASLHANVLKVAKKICGVELNESSLKELEKISPESEVNKYFKGDVQALDNFGIIDEFDVVLAGSIIEHLSNPGLMLQNVNRFLRKDGILLIATPHTWGILQILRVIFRKIEAVNPEHTCWYSIPTLIQLMSRYGFEPVVWATGYGWHPETIRWKVEKSIGIPILKAFPHLGGSLLGVFRLKNVDSF